MSNASITDSARFNAFNTSRSCRDVYRKLPANAFAGLLARGLFAATGGGEPGGDKSGAGDGDTAAMRAGSGRCRVGDGEDAVAGGE